jgi:phosphoadenosine phosphosulfate reductase
VGDRVRVAELSELNRRELQALSCGEEFFVFEPDSVAGNHLLKTVPLKEFIRRRGLKALATAIRWDEQPARAEERYFSPRQQPQHMRVQPLLHFTERDIWSIIHTFGIPYCSLYEQGYRSLGPRSSTKRFSELPAWLQDLTQSPERQGRGQDKEAAMQRLRSLGYM